MLTAWAEEVSFGVEMATSLAERVTIVLQEGSGRNFN